MIREKAETTLTDMKTKLVELLYGHNRHSETEQLILGIMKDLGRLEAYTGLAEKEMKEDV